MVIMMMSEKEIREKRDEAWRRMKRAENSYSRFYCKIVAMSMEMVLGEAGDIFYDAE